MSLTESNFKECFGDLSQAEQDNLKATLNRMTQIINGEIASKDYYYTNAYGDKTLIQLEEVK